jgi:hypothetical protein
MKQVNQVGVDVDSEALVSMMQRGGERLPLARFANTAAGHKKFIRWATKDARSARVCLEATGIYSLEFALALHHAKNVEVMVVIRGRSRILSGRACSGPRPTPWTPAASWTIWNACRLPPGNPGPGDPGAAGD